MADLRQILKGLGKTEDGTKKREEIILKYRHRLPQFDFELLFYTYIKTRTRANISMKVGIAESTYYSKIDKALARLEMLITDYEFRELIRLAKL